MLAAQGGEVGGDVLDVGLAGALAVADLHGELHGGAGRGAAKIILENISLIERDVVIAIQQHGVTAHDQGAVLERQMSADLHCMRIGEIRVGESELLGTLVLSRSGHRENVDAFEVFDFQADGLVALGGGQVGGKSPEIFVSADFEDVMEFERAGKLPDAAGGLLRLVT